MKRKPGKLFLSVCVITLMLAGCSSGSQTGVSVESSAEPSAEASPDVQETASNASEAGAADGLRLVSDSTNRESYATDAGIYYISIDTNKDKKGNGIVSLMYIDYATKKNIYLCNKPNCKHKDDSCQAVLPDDIMMGDYYLTGNDEHLYLITTQSDSAGSVSTADYVDPEYGELMTSGSSETPAQIWQMNLDGTNREKLCSLETGTVLSNVYFMDDEYMYAVAKSLKDEKLDDKSTYTASFNNRLIKIKLSDGSADDVLTLDEDDELLNSYGRNIVVGKLTFTKELTLEEEMDDNIYKKALKSAKYDVRIINADSGESRELKSFECKNDYSYVFDNNLMYYSVEKVPGINCINMETGEDSQLLAEGAYRLENIQDSHITALDGWTYEETYFNYIIDVNDKTAVKNTLRNDYSVPISILAEAGDKLLTAYNYKKEMEYVEWAGVNQEIITSYSYGLISREDYYDSKANYEDIDLIGMGLGY